MAATTAAGWMGVAARAGVGKEVVAREEEGSVGAALWAVQVEDMVEWVWLAATGAARVAVGKVVVARERRSSERGASDRRASERASERGRV